MRILGVDPGITGALALYDTDTGALDVCDMPSVAVRGKNGKTKRHLHEKRLCAAVRDFLPIDEAIIELVHAMPRQGVTSMFRFGEAAGLIRGIVVALGVPVSMVAPATWKRVVGLNSDKNLSRITAKAVFPACEKDFTLVKYADRAEAALLAWGYHNRGYPKCVTLNDI